MSDATFPIMDGPSIPWDLISPHELQAIANHDQALTRLAERGGLSCCEAVAVLEDRKWHRMDHDNALARLNEIRNADWQSRALAAEQERDKLKEIERFRVDALASMKASVKKLCGHLPELVIDTETGERICCECWAQEAEQERDQLKAELQQAREAFKEIDLEVQKMGELNGVHYFMDIRASKLRAILERIEKEKK